MKLARDYSDTGELSLLGQTASSQANGNIVHLALVVPGTLSALVTLGVVTAGLGLLPKWEVSADRSTWYTAAPDDPSTPVALGIGAATVQASSAVYGWNWARCSLVVTGASGQASDTYQISYSFERTRE